MGNMRFAAIPHYNSFSANDRARIIETVNENLANPVYGVHDGQPTADRIFLLSVEEVFQYFWADDDVFFGGVRERIKAVTIDGKPSRWWLRSGGSSSIYIATIHPNGDLDLSGLSPNNDETGVRPALWLNL